MCGCVVECLKKILDKGHFFFKNVFFFGKYHEWWLINSKTVNQCNICWCSTRLGIKGYEVFFCIKGPTLYEILFTFNNNKLSHFTNHEVAPLEYRMKNKNLKIGPLKET